MIKGRLSSPTSELRSSTEDRSAVHVIQEHISPSNSEYFAIVSLRLATNMNHAW